MGGVELVDKVAREGVLRRGCVSNDLKMWGELGHVLALEQKLLNFSVPQCPHL